MKIPGPIGVIALVAACFLAGCGGGGGGGVAAPVSTVVRGIASKGPIRIGTVRIFALNPDGSKGALLKSVPTDLVGGYQADITPYTGPVIAESSGSYIDEATGRTMTISDSAPLRAALPNASGSVQLAITPFTDLAVRQAQTLTAANISAANRAVNAVFPFDITSTQPVEPIDSAMFGPGTTQAQRDYTLALAAVSQMAGGAPVAPTLYAIAADMAGNDGNLSANMAATFQDALVAFLDPANVNNRTGATPASSNLTKVGAGKIVLKLSCAGSAAAVAGLQMTVFLPPGASVLSDPAAGDLLGEALAASGAGSGSATVVGKFLPLSHGVILAVISPVPFGAGEFATLTVNVPTGSAYTAGDFAVGGVKAVDSDGKRLTGVVVTATAADASPGPGNGRKNALVRLGSVGAAAASISGVQLTLTLPVGASVSADPATGAIGASMAVAGVAPANAMLAGKYAAQGRKVNLALLSITPFGSGDFAVLTVDVPEQSAYTAADFAAAEVKFIDVDGNTLSGISVTKTVTLQQ